MEIISKKNGNSHVPYAGAVDGNMVANTMMITGGATLAGVELAAHINTMFDAPFAYLGSILGGSGLVVGGLAVHSHNANKR